LTQLVWLKALAVKLSRPSGQSGSYTGLIGFNPHRLKGPKRGMSSHATDRSVYAKSSSSFRTVLVVIAKLMYASSAWWGLAGASDRLRLAAFIRRSDRSRFVYLLTFQCSQTCTTTPMRKCLQPSPATVIYITSCRLSPTGSQNYNLRQRTHNFALPPRSGHLTDNNFIQRMLYFDVY